MASNITWEPKKVNVIDLKENPNNPKILNEKGRKRLKKTLSKYGLAGTLIVNTDLTIIDGHSRKLELLQQGITEVFVSVPSRTLTDKEYAEFNAMFDLAKAGDPDMLLIENTFGDEFMEEWGLDSQKKTEIKDDEFDGIAPVVPITLMGDIYEIGPHRLICGDSTQRDTFSRLFGQEMADLVVTDPPYNMSYEGKTKKKLKIENDKQTNDNFYQFLLNFYTSLGEFTKPGGAWYVWHADLEGANFRMAMSAAGLMVKQCLIWVKNSMVMGRQDYQWQHEPCLYGWKEGAAHGWYSDRKQTTILEFDRPSRNAEHPTMKPVPLIAYLIGNSSKEGDTVADGFGGSGTTMVACQMMKRKGYLVEYDTRYCDVIVARMIKFGRETGSGLVIKRNGQRLSNQEIQKFIDNTSDV